MGQWMKRWAWGLATLLMSAVLPCSAASSVAPGPLASVAWLERNLNRSDLVLVDASPAPLHRQRHIPGAVLSAMFTFGPKDPPLAEIERHLQAWGVGPHHHVVLYDQGGTYMATRLFWDLVHRGFPAQRLSILDGGLSKWQAVGGAVTAEPTPRPAPGTVRLAALDAEVRVRLPEFLAATADPRRNVLLEALGPNHFFGGAAFFNRGGHVPHATLMPSEDFYNDDKTFKSAAEIQRMLDHLGVRRDQQVLTYCGGGGAAAVPYFALKHLLDYPRVRLFQESQMAWLQDERELPVWTYGNPHLVRETPWLKAWGSPMLKAFGLSNLSIVDVRAADAFRLGSVPLAVNVPASVFAAHRNDPAQLAERLGQAGVNPAHEAVVVSDGGLNEHAALAFVMLQSLGQHKVSIFLDSIERWAELGQDVARPAAGAATGRPASAPAAAPGAAAAHAAVQGGNPLLADAGASPGLFPKVYVASGARLPTRLPPGRVVHLPYAQFLQANGHPRAASEIWGALDKAGVPRYAQIVVFADTPGEAAVNYVVLRMMGYADVKVWAP